MIKTKIVKIDPANPNEDYLAEAASVLARGGLVIIPTETVYGIAVDIANKKATNRLYEIKNRPKDKPFTLHIDNKEIMEDFAVNIPPAAYKLIDQFWPGPLTLILQSKNKSTIGFRFPSDLIAQRIITLSQVRVGCPSANLSDKPAPVDFTQAITDLDGKVDFAVDAGATKLGIESTIVDLSGAKIIVVREGAIKTEDILKVASRKLVLFVCTGNSCRSVMAEGLLKKKLADKKRTDVDVMSAGMMLGGGLGPTQETAELLRQEGVDVSGHRSKKITRTMIKKADFILVMERIHEERILQIAPEAKNKVFLLKEFAKISADGLDIPDPIMSSFDFYKKTFDIIKNSVERVVEII